LQLCVTAISTMPLSYQWLLNSQPLSDEGLVTGSQTPCLAIGGVLTNGQFAVVVSGRFGSVTSPPVELTVSNLTVPFAKRTYLGLFYPPDAPTAQNSGALRLAVTKHGTFTGRVRYPGRAAGFTGKFDTNGFALVTVTGTGSEGPLYLQLDTTPGQERITGTITNGNSVAGLYLYLAGPSAETPTNGRKNFTLAMPGGSGPSVNPEGWSCMTASLGPGNNLSLACTLADGNIFTEVAPLSADGDFPLYAPLYQGTGLVIGWLKFTNDTAHGDWALWTKPDWRKNNTEGFALTTTVIGSLYSAPTPGANDLALTNGAGVLMLQNANVGWSLTNDVMVADNKVTMTNDVDALKMTFGAAHGRFIGSFMPPGMDHKVALHGVVLQDQGEAVGWFLEQDQSGSVSLQPSGQ
jgi:hypothetical protein